jgi:hypothetical protein
MNLFFAGYWVLLIILSIFSYGFIDLNLHLSANPVFLHLQKPLSAFVYGMRPFATGAFAVLLVGLSVYYLVFLRKAEVLFSSWRKLCGILLTTALVLALSFPALTYDLFNYIATAKVAFTYHENPYVVMPIEIPNDPNLAFTRAANKVALYGPVWITLTAIPHYLGAGDIWRTIVAFKLMNAAVYIGFSYLIYRVTKKLTNVIFFAANPLVLIEVLMNGHNDIYMMFLALGGLLLWQKERVRKKLCGFLLLVASWFIKGATLIVTPVLFFRKLTLERTLVWAYWLLAAVFFIATPIREELYPWYAVWLIMIAALLPLKSHRRLVEFTVVLSFALELRNLPYMWMGYYGGQGPLLRVVVTVVPVALYLGYLGIMHIKKIRS